MARSTINSVEVEFSLMREKSSNEQSKQLFQLHTNRLVCVPCTVQYIYIYILYAFMRFYTHTNSIRMMLSWITGGFFPHFLCSFLALSSTFLWIPFYRAKYAFSTFFFTKFLGLRVCEIYSPICLNIECILLYIIYNFENFSNSLFKIYSFSASSVNDLHNFSTFPYNI